MANDPDKIHVVPTNITTGYLGAGKTSTILHLLEKNVTNERWTVLVNEFGEIGVGKGQGVFVREIPGGCMCCAAGLSMQISLNQLFMHTKPNRLLIEPTCFG